MSFQIKPAPGLDESTTIDLELDVIVGKDLTSSQTFQYDGAVKTDYATTLPSGKNMRMVKGNGVYVAIEMATEKGFMHSQSTNTSFVTNKVYYSADAITWSSATLPSTWAVKDLKFLNGKFYIVAHPADAWFDSYVLASSDGAVWSTALSTQDPAIVSQVNTPLNLNKIAYGNGKIIAIGYGEEAGMQVTQGYSSIDNGVTWTSIYVGYGYAQGVNYAWGAFIYGNGMFMLFDNGSAGNGYRSKDGVTWTQMAVSNGADDAIVYNGAVYTSGKAGVYQWRLETSAGMEMMYQNYSKSIQWMGGYPTYSTSLIAMGGTIYFSSYDGTVYVSTLLNKKVDNMNMVSDAWTTSSVLNSNSVFTTSSGVFKKNLAAILKSLM